MIIVINGGTQGLGEATARRLVATGFTQGVTLTGRSAARGSALASDLIAAGIDTIFIEADSLDPEMPSSVVETTVDHFGTIDGLVNVAASTARGTLFEDSLDDLQQMFALNVYAPYFLIQAASKHMIEAGHGGSIVNVGSTSGHGGQTKLTAYSMSKGALTIMTKNLAFGLMQHGIRVNQVNPGWMETESEHRTQTELDGAPDDWLERAAPGRPLGRLVQPWEAANAIAYCLSPESGLLTGNCIDVDQSVQGAGDPPLPTADDTVNP